MMIKITEKCSMGCTHCMNDATANGKHMTDDVYKKVIDFQKRYGGLFCMITGGEPSEHPAFKAYIAYAKRKLPNVFITIATNGTWMEDNYQYINDMYYKYQETLLFQVCNDPRYYPKHVDFSHPVFSLPNVIVIDNVPKIYPQGRAVTNNLEWSALGSKCFNVRAMTHQIEHKSLEFIIAMLAVKEKICTPHITIDGSIKVGESDLCPVCSHIDKSEEEIIQDILTFRCQKCNHVNKNLSKNLREIIGE